MVVPTEPITRMLTFYAASSSNGDRMKFDLYPGHTHHFPGSKLENGEPREFITRLALEVAGKVNNVAFVFGWRYPRTRKLRR